MSDSDQGQRERNSVPPLRWFARDDPIADLAAEDSFGHAAYTEALADAILRAEAPFTIGVFGDWGVGKTTIARTHLETALRRKAGKDKIAYAYFDVWKYEEDTLRRQFLRDVATQLKEAGALAFTYKPEKKLEDLVVDIREVAEKGIRISWRQALLALLRGAIVGGVLFLALRVLDRLNVLESGNDLALSLIAGLITASASELGRVIVVGEREVIRRSIDAPDLFEDKFKDLMNHVKADRVVIVIDNLDRCASDRVVEVLSTIKTFLEPTGAKVQPIFVIPCDREAIHRHLEKQGEMKARDADEYLRKFFGLALRINPILEEEIRAYAARELERLALGKELTEEQTRELTQIIGIAFRENPRRVKQFLNTLTSKLMLIREEAAKVIDPPISGEIPFLAKLTVIEEEWPEFYEAIRADPRSFDLLSQRAIGVPVEVSEHLAKTETDPLKAFLRGTRRTVSRNIRAFTRLKLTPIELKLTNFSDYRNALLDGRLEDVTKLLMEVPEANREPYREAVVTILKEEISNGYVETALNVVDAAIRLGELQSKAVAAEVIEQLYAVQGLRDLLPSLAPFETLRFLELTDSDASLKLIGEYLNLLGRSDLAPLVPQEQLPRWQTEVVRGLMRLRAKLDDSQLAALRQLANGPLAQNLDLLNELARTEDGPKHFIGPQALEAALNRLAIEELTVGDDGALIEGPTTTIWLRSLDFADSASVSRFVQRAGELFSQMPAEESAPGRRGLLELLFRSRSVLSPAESGLADQLAQQVQNHYPQTPGSVRWQVIAILCGLYPSLSDSWKEQARNLVIQFAGEDPRDVGQFVASMTKEEIEAVPEQMRDALFARLKERFRASGQPEEQQGLARMFVTNAVALGWEHVEGLLNEAVDAGNFNAVANAIQAFKGEITTGQADLLPKIATRLLSRITAMSPSEQGPAFDALMSLADLLSDDQRLAIRDHLAALISSEDGNARETGLTLLDTAERHRAQREAERRYIVEHVVQSLYGQVDRLDESVRRVLDRVTKDIGLAEESTLDNLVSVLKGLLPRNPALREFASEYLVALSLTGKRRDEVVEELVHWAKQEGDTNIRHGLIRHAHEIARADRGTKGWKLLESYLRELEKGEDPDRSLSAELLGEVG